MLQRSAFDQIGNTEFRELAGMLSRYEYNKMTIKAYRRNGNDLKTRSQLSLMVHTLPWRSIVVRRLGLILAHVYIHSQPNDHRFISEIELIGLQCTVRIQFELLVIDLQFACSRESRAPQTCLCVSSAGFLDQ